MSSTTSSEVVQKPPCDGEASTAPNHNPLADLIRDKNFWFEDGNVVIVAQNTGFKVYKGLLAAQSPVFQDLFASASHAEEVFEGCPVVRLTDFLEDLRYLLPFLLPTTHVRIPTDINMASEAEYNQLSALLLLGDKYQLESISYQAADCFKAAFTNDFDRWDARPEADGLHVRAGSEPSTRAADHRLRAIDAVHLARITDASSVLPLALYHCALLGDAAADGWTRADGRVHRLSAADLKRCEDGHRYLCEQRAGFLVGLFKADPSPECRTRIICGGLLEYLHGKGAAVYETTPALLDRPDGWTYRLALCMRCARELEEREKGARRELWQKLPEIFRLKEAEVKVWEA